MTPVECYFVTPDGDPVINTPVEIQPAKSGFEEELSGIVMPRPVSTVTDDQGKVTVELWPGPIMYHVTVFDTVSDVGLHYKFLVPLLDVPGTTVRLQDIVIDGEMSNRTWDEAAILAIHDAKANAAASQVAAKASELAAAQSQAAAAASEAIAVAKGDAAVTSAGAALISQNAAKASEDASKASQTAAGNSEANAAASAAAALASKTAAGTSETNAAGSAASALGSKNAAALSETNAAGSEAAALASKTAAGTSATNAAASEANALASKNAAAASATAAAGSTYTGLGLADLNTVTSPGRYSVNGTDAQGVTNNWPVLQGGSATQLWFNVTVNGNGTRLTQIAEQVFAGSIRGRTFRRFKHDGNWGAWTEQVIPSETNGAMAFPPGNSVNTSAVLSIGDGNNPFNSAGPSPVGVRNVYRLPTSATSGFGYTASLTVGDGTAAQTLTNLYNLFADRPTVNANAAITTFSHILTADVTSTSVATAYGVRCQMNTLSGKVRWNLFMDGTAPNHFAGNVLIGSAVDDGSGKKLQVTGGANFSGGGVTGIGKADVGLPLADNTPDASKPVSTAQAAAIAIKYDKAGGAIAGPAYTPPKTIAFSATPTFDAAQGNVHYMGSLTGNVTTLTINNPQDGQTLNIRFVQDVMGSRTVALPANVKASGAIDPTASRASWLVLTYVAAGVNRWEGSWSWVGA